MSAGVSGRWIEYVRLEDIRPAERNAKAHDAGGIAAGIDRFGFIDLPVLDERTGRLVSGHGRHEAALAAAADPDAAVPDGLRAGPDGAWEMPVLRGWASRDDDEALAAGIALNRLVESGDWDREALAAQLAELSDGPGEGLAGVGFDAGDLAALVEAIRRETAEWSEERGSGAAARREKSIDEEAAGYRNKAVRTLVLDYPLDDYQRVVAWAKEARKRHGIDGNAELFRFLLLRWEKEHPT